MMGQLTIPLFLFDYEYSKCNEPMCYSRSLLGPADDVLWLLFLVYFCLRSLCLSDTYKHLSMRTSGRETPGATIVV